MGVVQGTSHPEHVVMDIESVAGMLPPGSVYAFLAEHRRELFPDAMFADRVLDFAQPGLGEQPGQGADDIGVGR